MSAPNCGSDNNYKNDLYTNYDNEGWNDINALQKKSRPAVHKRFGFTILLISYLMLGIMKDRLWMIYYLEGCMCRENEGERNNLA